MRSTNSKKEFEEKERLKQLILDLRKETESKELEKLRQGINTVKPFILNVPLIELENKKLKMKEMKQKVKLERQRLLLEQRHHQDNHINLQSSHSYIPSPLEDRGVTTITSCFITANQALNKSILAAESQFIFPDGTTMWNPGTFSARCWMVCLIQSVK
jgi:hypothetical protein